LLFTDPARLILKLEALEVPGNGPTYVDLLFTKAATVDAYYHVVQLHTFRKASSFRNVPH